MSNNLNDPDNANRHAEANSAALAAANMLKGGLDNLPPLPPSRFPGGTPPVTVVETVPPGIIPRSPEALPPAPLDAFVVPALTAEEINALRDLVFSRARKRKEEFELPIIDVTEDDRERFAECLSRKIPFSEKFSMMKGKLAATFRTKTKRETDLLHRQIDKDFADGLILSEGKYVSLLNNYNLMFQMVNMQGTPMPLLTPPPGVPVDKDWSLQKFLPAHPIEGLPDILMYLLIGALTQFDQKVKTLSNEALSGNFFEPASAS